MLQSTEYVGVVMERQCTDRLNYEMCANSDVCWLTEQSEGTKCSSSRCQFK
jgi:hypothetical protein